MRKSEVKTMRINPVTERELYDFVNSKGGLKKALQWLFNNYKLNQKVDNIVDRLKDDLKFMPAPQQTVIKAKEPSFAVDDGRLNGFLG